MRDVFSFHLFNIQWISKRSLFLQQKKKQKKLETHDSGAMLPAVASLGKI